MPNYVLLKDATPMNQHFEITMFTSKFCADLAMQKPFQSTEHTARYDPVLIYHTFCFEKMMHGKIDASF